jgi:hypothetical protein
MDIQMKLRDFVVNTDGEYILKNCREGDRCSRILTKDMVIESVTPSGLTISLVDEPDQMIMVLLPNDDKILINAEECPIGEFLGERKVLYERTYIKKWNNTLSPGHFYLTFADDEQINGVVFLRRLEDQFLEWEEFSRVKNYDSYHTQSRIVQLSMDLLMNLRFIPLYGIGLDLNEE